MPIPVLTLRPEFRSAALKGTAIELATRSKTGATQIPAAEFLNITYPSYDLLAAVNETLADTTIDTEDQVQGVSTETRDLNDERHDKITPQNSREI
jgi:hypothetical protein